MVKILLEYKMFDVQNEEIVLQKTATLCKKFALFLLKDQSMQIDWEQLLPDSFRKPQDTISSALKDIAGLEKRKLKEAGLPLDAVWQYADYLLADNEVRMIAWQRIAEELHLPLEQIVRDYYIDTVANANLKYPDGITFVTQRVVEALANIRVSRKPSFLAVNTGEHWIMVGIVPDPKDVAKISLVLMDSQLPLHFFASAQERQRAVIDFTTTVIKNNNLGTQIHTIQDLSVRQQVSQCCGLAAAENIASIAKFYTETVGRDASFNPDTSWTSFQEGSVNSLYILFSPWVDNDDNKALDYVKKRGKQAFDFLSSAMGVKNYLQNIGQGTIDKISAKQLEEEQKTQAEVLASQQHFAAEEGIIGYSDVSYQSVYELTAKQQLLKQDLALHAIAKEYNDISALYQLVLKDNSTVNIEYFVAELQNGLITKWNEKAQNENSAIKSNKLRTDLLGPVLS
ncbi:hypothetical protein MIDIC_70047 [Alphaproteobacteria bacterium]